MKRQWFWYPHLSLDTYLNDLGCYLFDLDIKLPNASSPVRIRTDEPALLDLLRKRRYGDYSSPSSHAIPELTYLHNTAPIRHSTVLTAQHLLSDSREHTDISFIPETCRVVFHRPGLESIIIMEKANHSSVPSEFLLAYSLGLTKSLLNGLASFVEPDSVGCHAAVLKLKGTGVALLGSSGSGKSTHGLRFLLAQEDTLLVTDDWSIVSRRDSQFVATALEQQFFARKTQFDKLVAHHPQAVQSAAQGPPPTGDDSRVDLDLRSILGHARFADQLDRMSRKNNRGETENTSNDRAGVSRCSYR